MGAVISIAITCFKYLFYDRSLIDTQIKTYMCDFLK